MVNRSGALRLARANRNNDQHGVKPTTMARTLVNLAVPLVAAVAASCASNAFVASWQAPDAVPLHVDGARVAAVVVMRPVGTQTEVVTAPGSTLWTAPSYSGFWGGYYAFGWNSPWAFGVSAPPEIRTNTIVSIETLVYSLRQNKLVWGGQSRTTNPASVDRLVRDTAAKVARKLDRRGLMARPQAGG